MITIKRYHAPKNMQQSVIVILKSLNIPEHSAMVYEEDHDIRYHGLTTSYTIIDIDLKLDGELFEWAENALGDLGFLEVGKFWRHTIKRKEKK